MKYKVRGDNPEPRKKQPRYEPIDTGHYADPYAVDKERIKEEPFNLERGTGLNYPGAWLDRIAGRNQPDNDDVDEDDSTEEGYDDYQDEDYDY